MSPTAASDLTVPTTADGSQEATASASTDATAIEVVEDEVVKTPAKNKGKGKAKASPAKSAAAKAKEKEKEKETEEKDKASKSSTTRKSDRVAKKARTGEKEDGESEGEKKGESTDEEPDETDDLFSAFPDPVPVPDDDVGPITLLSGSVGLGVMFDVSVVGDTKPLPIPSLFVAFARELIAHYNKNVHKRHGTTASNWAGRLLAALRALATKGTYVDSDKCPRTIKDRVACVWSLGGTNCLWCGLAGIKCKRNATLRQVADAKNDSMLREWTNVHDTITDIGRNLDQLAQLVKGSPQVQKMFFNLRVLNDDTLKRRVNAFANVAGLDVNRSSATAELRQRRSLDMKAVLDSHVDEQIEALRSSAAQRAKMITALGMASGSGSSKKRKATEDPSDGEEEDKGEGAAGHFEELD